MARVPTADPIAITPQIGPTVFDPTRASPDAFGAAEGRAQQAIGQQLSQLGGQIIEQERQFQIQDNERELKDALNSLDQQSNLIWSGDGHTEHGHQSQNPGFRNLQGVSANEVHEQTRDSLLSIQGEISQGLSSDHLRRLFAASSAKPITRSLTLYADHNNDQRRVASEATSQARSDQARQNAIVHFNDDEVIAENILVAQDEAFKSNVNKLGQEAAIEMGEVAASSVVKAAIVSALSAQQTGRAQELFTDLESTLQGNDLIKTRNMISSAIDLEFAQEQADVVVVLSRKEDGTIDIEKAIGLLRETPGLKGKQLQDSITELSKRIAEAETFKIQRLNDAESNLDQHLAQGGTLSEWTSQNPDLWEEIQGDSARANRIQAYREGQASLQLFAGVSDGITWRRMVTMNSEDLTKLDVEAFRGQLTEGEFNSVTLAQIAAINSSEAASQTPSQVRSIFKNARTIIKAAANSIPAIRDQDESDESGIRFLLDRKMDEFVQKFTDVGKEPTAKELNAEASRLILKIQSGDPGLTVWGLKWANIGQDEDFFEGLAARSANLSVRQRQSVIVPIDSMTASQVETWTTLYRSKGIEPTENMLEQLGGAIAVKDIRRERRLLTKKVKRQSGVAIPLGEQ